MVGGPLPTSLNPLGPPRPWYPTTFTPLKLPGLEQWFDADQAGGTDGAPLATLTDLSGKGKHGTQATAGKQALWIANAQNGHAAIRTDGVDDFYALTGLSINSSTDKTIVVCFKSPTSAANQRYLFDSATGRLALFISNDASHLAGYLDGTTARQGTAHVATPQILTYTFMMGVQGEIRRNSTVIALPAMSSRAIGGTTALFSNSGGTGLFVDCDLYGWIVCSRSLGTLDRSSAEVYYKLKYGIS